MYWDTGRCLEDFAKAIEIKEGKGTQFLASEKAQENRTDALVQTDVSMYITNIWIINNKKNHVSKFGLKSEKNENKRWKGYKFHAWVRVGRHSSLSFLQPMAWPTSPNQTNCLTQLSSTLTCFYLTYVYSSVPLISFVIHLRFYHIYSCTNYFFLKE